MLACLVWVLFSGVAAGATIWIDTDPAIGAPWREVDDAFALILAFHSPEVRIAGISTTYGNAPLRRTTAVAHDIVRRFGGRAELTASHVHPGASSRADFEKRTPAAEALARVLRKRRLTYVALGPLTNLAAFLQVHPELSGNIDRVIFVGGRSPGQQFTFGPTGALRIHDANVIKDRAAAAVVLRSALPLTLAPVEISSQLTINRADLRTLRAGGPAGRYLHARTRVWGWFWMSFVREKGGPLFDLLAVLPAIDQRLLKTEPRFAYLNATGDLIAAPRTTPGTKRVSFGTAVKTSAKPLVLRRLR